MIRVFTYGTLRPSLGARGGWNAERMFGRTDYPSEPAVLPRGTLYDVGGYPALDPSCGDAVVGELIAVDHEQLARLDSLEGILPGKRRGYTYQRVLYKVRVGDATEWAWVYVARRSLSYARLIVGGDWAAYWEAAYGAR